MTNGIGAKIKELREGKHLSQIELARLLNVSDKTVSAWENGTRNPKNLIAIANALGVNVETLTDGIYKSRDISVSYLSRYDVENGKIIDNKAQQSIFVRSVNGYISIEVDGKKGEFMDMYTSLYRSGKRQVIRCMIEDAGLSINDFFDLNE